MWSIKRFFRSRGVRVITCPETHNEAAVSLDALHAAASGSPRLASCSRWPERAGCNQACLKQIASSPNGCLLKSIVTQWYAGKSCIECGRPIGAISWTDAPPAVREFDGSSHEWSDYEPQDLPRLFEISDPLCWYCNNVNELAHLRPNLIVRRREPQTPAQPLLPTTATY
jgi:hypothetical protein